MTKPTIDGARPDAPVPCWICGVTFGPGHLPHKGARLRTSVLWKTVTRWICPLCFRTATTLVEKDWERLEGETHG